MKVKGMTKRCPKCGKTLNVNRFYPNKKTHDGCAGWCKECCRQDSRLRRSRRDSAWYRKNNLRKLYGMTVEDYEALLQKQGRGCAICGSRKYDRTTRRLAVDHDRITGQVRGLLCYRHNVGIGFFDHDVKLLRAAATYLARTGSRRGR